MCCAVCCEDRCFAVVFLASSPSLVEPIGEAIRVMSARYSNVDDRGEIIMRTIQQEEERFAETLSRGLPMVQELMDKARGHDGVIPGDQAFVLHDTYGFPLG